MKSKILVFGGNGLLGKAFEKMKEKEEVSLILLGSQDADITNPDSIEKVIKKHNPDIVVNCAALINVDKCEEEPKLTYEVNGEGPPNIVNTLIDSSKKVVFIQISTSDVFKGDSGPYGEDSMPDPINVYGSSKLAGEKAVLEISENHANISSYIVRTGWLYGEGRQTFIDTVVSTLRKGEIMKVIYDQYNVLTYTNDLVDACHKLITSPQKFPSGIYHFTNEFSDKPSKYDAALFIAEILSLDVNLVERSSREDVFKIPRPENTLLINSSDIKLPDWKVSLASYLKKNYT